MTLFSEYLCLFACSALGPNSNSQNQAGQRLELDCLKLTHYADRDALRVTVTRIADALRLPPDRARTALAAVNVGSFPLPSPTRINGVREEIRAARQSVLDALAR